MNKSIKLNRKYSQMNIHEKINYRSSYVSYRSLINFGIDFALMLAKQVAEKNRINNLYQLVIIKK